MGELDGGGEVFKFAWWAGVIRVETKAQRDHFPVLQFSNLKRGNSIFNCQQAPIFAARFYCPSRSRCDDASRFAAGNC